MKIEIKGGKKEVEEKKESFSGYINFWKKFQSKKYCEG